MASALHTTMPLEFENSSKTIAPAPSPGSVVPSTTLGNHNLGYGMMYIWGSNGGSPWIDTYDPPSGPGPHPPEDPHPSKGIPLKGGEPKVPGTPIEPGTKPPIEIGYLNTSRGVHIVKVYEKELINGQIEHVATKVQKYCPDQIKIQDEPTYKVVNYYSSKYFYDYQGSKKLNNDTTWNEIVALAPPTDPSNKSIAGIEVENLPYDTYNKEFSWDEIEDRHADQGKEMSEGDVEVGQVKLWAACEHFDAEKDGQNPIDLNRTDIAHHGDNTLYVRLREKEEVPQSHTYDWHKSPKKPGPAPDPTQDDNHPEYPYNPTPASNRFLKYRVVKVYENELPDLSLEIAGVFERPNAPPIYDVDDEDPYDLIEWRVGDSDDGNWESISGDTWEEIATQNIHVSSGPLSGRVNMLDMGDLENNNKRTLYVRLRAPSIETVYEGDIVIQESQITKTVHTNDPTVNTDKGYWGNYKFQLSIGGFQESHTATYRGCCHCSCTCEERSPHCCCSSCPADNYSSCSCGHECSFTIPGRYGERGNGINEDAGDDLVTFSFWQTSEPDGFEIDHGVSAVLNPMTLSAFPVFEEFVTSLESNTYTYSSNGAEERGVEWITSIWRGGDALKDIPTLALYKQDDITNQSETMNWFNYDVPNEGTFFMLIFKSVKTFHLIHFLS